VHINPFQAADITTNADPNVKTLDYQNTDDIVINQIPLVSSPGDIRNADHRIREKSNDSNIFTRHRSSIDSQGGNFWKRIRKKISSSLVDSSIRLPNHTRTNKGNPNQKT
jgi:hypothetical protein